MWEGKEHSISLINDMIYINEAPFVINDVIMSKFEFSNYINNLIRSNKDWASKFMFENCPLELKVRGSSLLIDKLQSQSLTKIEAITYTHKIYEPDQENYLNKLKKPEDDLNLLDKHKNRGLVIAVGDENKSCKRGDIIYFREKAGIPYKVNGFIYYILWESEFDLIQNGEQKL